MSTRSPTYRLPTRRRAEAPAERPAEAEVPVGSESPDAVSCEDHSYLRGLTPAVLSSLTTPSRSNPASVDSLPFSHSPPGASPGASMLSDDETEEEAELRREQEQEQARRLYAANGSSLAALDARAAGEEEDGLESECLRMRSLTAVRANPWASIALRTSHTSRRACTASSPPAHYGVPRSCSSVMPA